MTVMGMVRCDDDDVKLVKCYKVDYELPLIERFYDLCLKISSSRDNNRMPGNKKTGGKGSQGISRRTAARTECKPAVIILWSWPAAGKICRIEQQHGLPAYVSLLSSPA
jgi:hypothetical protein